MKTIMEFTDEELRAEVRRRTEEERKRKAEELEEMYKSHDHKKCFICSGCKKTFTAREVDAFEARIMYCPDCEEMVV